MILRLLVDAFLAGCSLVCLLRCLSIIADLITRGYTVRTRSGIRRRLVLDRDMKTIVVHVCLYTASSAGYLIALFVWDAFLAQALSR